MLSEYYYSLGLTPEELDTLQEAFQLYDIKEAGYISTEQFSHILISLGIATEPTQIAQIVQFVDNDHDNKIDFHEFALAMSRYLPHEQPAQPPVCRTSLTNHVYSDKDADDEELRACFQFFDKDCDGRISPDELDQVMKKFNTTLTPKEIKEMMSIADLNKDGFIDFDEFKKLLPPL